MPFNEAIARQMDEAASQAKNELEAKLDQMSARDIISWWTKWYLKAGHKRLGRILVAMEKQRTYE